MNWQPIETAPKDGSPVWAKGYNYGSKRKVNTGAGRGGMALAGRMPTHTTKAT